jgi:hypothetical protein
VVNEGSKLMRSHMRAGLGPLSLVVTVVAGGLTLGVAAAPPAGATVAMGTLSGGLVSPVAGTTHTDFPDPAIAFSGTANTYYAYATGTAPLLGGNPASWTGGGIGGTTIGCNTGGCTDQSARSVAMTITRAPASITRFWGLQAPSVTYLNNQWVMYYAGLYAPSGKAYAVYYSTSSNATSGFNDTGAEAPLVYQGGTSPGEGGSTDPSAFVGPTGQPWLLWKSGTYGGGPKAHIWSMRLATSGTALKTGTLSYEIVNQPTGGWTGATTVENPQMVWSGGTYYLFYSGGHWTKTTYGEGYTTCTGPTGGCGTPNTHEILSSSTSGTYGPGGGSLFTTSTGSWLMAFHSWNSSCTGYGSPCYGARQLYVRPIAGLFSTSLPHVNSFTASPSSLPSSGGSVTLTASATRAVSYTFTASPAVSGLPITVHTTGSAHMSVTLPANETTSSRTFTFTVEAAGPYGGITARQLHVSESRRTGPRPSIIQESNGVLEVMVQGPNNTLYGYWNISGTWYGPLNIGPAYGPPSIIQEKNGVLEVMVQGPNHTLYGYWNISGTWYGPLNIGTAYGPPSIIQESNGVLEVMVQGPNHTLYGYWNITGTWYGPWHVGTAYGPPSIIQESNGVLEVMVQGPNNTLYGYWNISGTWYGPWHVGTAYGPPSIIQESNGVLEVMVQGPNNTLYGYWNITGTWYGPWHVGAD